MLTHRHGLHMTHITDGGHLYSQLYHYFLRETGSSHIGLFQSLCICSFKIFNRLFTGTVNIKDYQATIAQRRIQNFVFERRKRKKEKRRRTKTGKSSFSHKIQL